MHTVKTYIVLADDDPDDRQTFTEAFAQQFPGMIIQQTVSGRDLLHFLENCPSDRLPSLLVLDYNMPDLSAPDVLRSMAANARYNNITTIVWSSSQRTKDREECKRLGASHYIIKPGSIDELKRTICQLVDILAISARPAN